MRLIVNINKKQAGGVCFGAVFFCGQLRCGDTPTANGEYTTCALTASVASAVIYVCLSQKGGKNRRREKKLTATALLAPLSFPLRIVYRVGDVVLWRYYL